MEVKIEICCFVAKFTNMTKKKYFIEPDASVKTTLILIYLQMIEVNSYFVVNHICVVIIS